MGAATKLPARARILRRLMEPGFHSSGISHFRRWPDYSVLGEADDLSRSDRPASFRQRGPVLQVAQSTVVVDIRST